MLTQTEVEHRDASAKIDVLARLKSQTASLLREIEADRAWQLVTSPDTPPATVAAIMREIYAEIAAYQPDVIEATIAVIGQFPRSLPAKRIRAMLVHQSEEWDHGEMAVRDHVGLGGHEQAVRARMTPTAFATAAFWRMIAHKRMPFAYLGALYLFEGLTPIVTAGVKPMLQNKGFGADALEYIEFHSTEDIRHAKIIEALIRDAVVQYPEKAGEVLFGFEAFRHVYPLPGWRAACARALAAIGEIR